MVIHQALLRGRLFCGKSVFSGGLGCPFERSKHRLPKSDTV